MSGIKLIELTYKTSTLCVCVGVDVDDAVPHRIKAENMLEDNNYLFIYILYAFFL